MDSRLRGGDEIFLNYAIILAACQGLGRFGAKLKSLHNRLREGEGSSAITG